MEFHHPLGSSSYNSPWALFMSSREWQKTNVTAPSSSSKAWFSCRGLQLPFRLGMNKGWLSTLTLLSLVGTFWIGLAYLGWFLQARLCASYKMDINNTCLSRAFIPHGLSLVDTLVFFLQWAFGQLVVIFETIRQASKCSCKFHIVNNAHGF